MQNKEKCIGDTLERRKYSKDNGETNGVNSDRGKKRD